MVAGISHSQAVKLVHPFRKKGESYETDDNHGLLVLRRLGFKVQKRTSLKDFTTLKQPAIVAFAIDSKSGHVAVWDPEQQKILNPSRGFDLANEVYMGTNPYKGVEYILILRR